MPYPGEDQIGILRSFGKIFQNKLKFLLELQSKLLSFYTTAIMLKGNSFFLVCIDNLINIYYSNYLFNLNIVQFWKNVQGQT